MSSIIKVDTIQTAAGGVPTAGDLGLNITGTVLQVVNSNFTNQYSSTVFDTWVDFGLNASVTPVKTNSNWLIMATLHAMHFTTQIDWPPHFTAYIGSNPASPVGSTTSNNRPNVHVASFQAIAPGTDAAPYNQSLHVLDSTTNLTAGTATTFAIKAYAGRGSGTWYINRANTMYNDDISGSNPICSMTVMEIAS